jgi:C-methyltransferase
MRRDARMSAAASAELQGRPIYQAAFSNLEHTLRTGRPAIEAVAPDGFFAYLRAHPEEARIFDDAMSSTMAMGSVGGIVGAYDFSRFDVIADIGGGHGALARTILEYAPNTRAILFDLPEVVAGAVPAGRLQVQEGNFLKDPLPPADLHILKLILHDWPDAAALTILSAVRRAARVGGKLLVIEALMTEEAGVSSFAYHERQHARNGRRPRAHSRPASANVHRHGISAVASHPNGFAYLSDCRG